MGDLQPFLSSPLALHPHSTNVPSAAPHTLGTRSLQPCPGYSPSGGAQARPLPCLLLTAVARGGGSNSCHAVVSPARAGPSRLPRAGGKCQPLWMNPEQFKLFPRLFVELLPWGLARGCQAYRAGGPCSTTTSRASHLGGKGYTREEVGSGQGGSTCPDARWPWQERAAWGLRPRWAGWYSP